MQNTWELRSQYKSKMKWRRCFVYELIRCRNFNLLWLLVLITLICQLVGTAWNAEESTFGCDTLYTHPFLRKHPMHAVYLQVPTKINLELWKVYTYKFSDIATFFIIMKNKFWSCWKWKLFTASTEDFMNEIPYLSPSNGCH